MYPYYGVIQIPPLDNYRQPSEAAPRHSIVYLLSIHNYTGLMQWGVIDLPWPYYSSTVWSDPHAQPVEWCGNSSSAELKEMLNRLLAARLLWVTQVPASSSKGKEKEGILHRWPHNKHPWVSCKWKRYQKSFKIQNFLGLATIHSSTLVFVWSLIRLVFNRLDPSYCAIAKRHLWPTRCCRERIKCSPVGIVAYRTKWRGRDNHSTISSLASTCISQLSLCMSDPEKVSRNARQVSDTIL